MNENESETSVLPPPPPPTISFSDVERIEGMVAQLHKQMDETNVRRRFKMCVYLDWCKKMSAILVELRKLRGAG